jgi:hypothetical protein
VAAGPATRAQWGVAALAAALGAVSLAIPGASRVDAALGAYVVLVSAAFICTAVLAPTGALRMAIRATLLGAAGTLLLVAALWGPGSWTELAWQAAHEVRSAFMHQLVDVPIDGMIVDGVVQAVSSTLPAMVLLETLAGLTLAWQLHVRIAAQPLGPPLTPFREFRLGDQWIWGLVGAITIWLVPGLTGFRVAALNLLVVLAMLYLLRGAAIVVAFAAAAGISAGALVFWTAVAAIFAVPLLLIVPSLWTLGMTDTWLQFRRRLQGRPTHT